MTQAPGFLDHRRAVLDGLAERWGRSTCWRDG